MSLRVVLAGAAAVRRGDGVDDLPVGERVAVPAEVRLQIDRRLGHPRPDDEPQPGLVELAQVRRRQHPGVGDHDHVGQVVPRLELLDDRDDRRGLGLVALEAADLEREAAPVDQQPDHDLRVDAAFLGVADLAQVVFLLGLEVERGHVVEHQRHIAVRGGVVEARGRDLVAVPALAATAQGGVIVLR